ncbi:hypothetical protein COU54_02935 [Candidatus Pacearchaeota archaeon CG10_big_fil_rev_8_21_14_0_10_31_24]|nr:MAG: hypothetical protein COU54_02935 [Candidatus Pacearchaeota archaeon CG10_big_fil_rev_8_21_14_0_10_31_24]
MNNYQSRFINQGFNKLYLVIDTSFLLGDILTKRNSFDQESFYQRCKYVREVGGKCARVLDEIDKELDNLSERCNLKSEMSRGRTELASVEIFPSIPNIREDYLFTFLTAQIEKIGKKLNNETSKKELSQVDINYGSYSILKTTKGDVIAATRDNLLIDSMREVYRIAHPVFMNLGNGTSDRKLYFARTCFEVDNALREISIIKSIRGANHQASFSKGDEKAHIKYLYMNPLSYT